MKLVNANIMTNEEKYKEIGIGLQNKYPKIDLAYHFANCNADDPNELGKMASDESEMWGNMLKKAYWVPIGGKLQEI